ncbi:MAG TPA: hypothetical protein VNH82_11915 [Candidatus Dormibacteraeota bacterium]|nr:hypothetical protein [Candidatus Dormibacteraeota bacterium]
MVTSLVEGNSIRPTVRMTGVAKNTVTKLLVELGAACSGYQDDACRGLTCRRLQADEIWALCHSRAAKVQSDHKGEFGYGDVWAWVAIEADTKLVPSWLVGDRWSADAKAFVADLADRMANRVQLTTDGFHLYLDAVEDAFGPEIDYVIVQKIYGAEDGQRRYSPPECIGGRARRVQGNPDPRHVSPPTSSGRT